MLRFMLGRNTVSITKWSRRYWNKAQDRQQNCVTLNWYNRGGNDGSVIINEEWNGLGNCDKV